MLVLLLIASATSPVHATPLAKPCRTATTPVGEGKTPKAGVHPLGQEPAADVYKTVYREVDGCPKPLLVKRDVGAHEPK